MENFKFEDGTLEWSFDPTTVEVVSGDKKLSLFWADNFAIVIEDSSDEELYISEVAKVEFLIPASSHFYELCKKEIPNNYIIYADNKPDDSNKHIRFDFNEKGMLAQIDSDYMSPDDYITTSICLMGVFGGSNQNPDYKDHFVKFFRGLLNEGKTLQENSKVKKKQF